MATTNDPTWTILEHRAVSREIGKMDKRAQKEAAVLIEALRLEGNKLGMPRSRHEERGIHCLRGHQLRILYAFLPGRVAVLLMAVQKKENRIDRHLPTVFARAKEFGL